ncbi:TRAP transporter small permease [Sulfitobacter sp. KE34]|uniref:TRAP transporter small permease n=1 Tax=unclassified Sulfitobacter TaxID=196795 RepID=UPI0023E2B508|nr:MULTISPECIES: TRAP transporter small permease [unclassified Sulfitobacter]MDF3351844.1 TRAP transporter small permease [Sulfitobacter sp. KE12]MDF3355516.1 TRAP transporter small permease [Sulfitobacter sp. KE27]MDF3359164.1 TRAP transporter small permease [Sulfitobacter sp. KE33]MDF3366588.1 TRAP transporter small permease [Sulfitobacter sp. Ks34]MDF3370197.1 TRAP transporter small permease [Sulfitobacter sp. Ks43]
MRFLLNEFEKIVCAVLFLGMTLIGFINVVVRYATHYSFAASEEILTNGFLLLTVFGAAIAARRGQHLAVTIVQDFLPRPAARAVFMLSVVLSVLLLAASAWFSWATLINQMDSGIRSYALGVPAWWYQIGLPFGFALIIIRYLQHAAEMWRATRQESRT